MSQPEVSAEELTALVQAIKFAHPNFTLKQVHNQVLSHGGSFANVSIPRVKKYLKKLGLTGNPSTNEDVSNPVTLMTIGGESKSKVPSNAPSESSPDMSEWMPVMLDVPQMQMSSFPYQAIISLTQSSGGSADGSLGEIYKIQKALSEGSAVQHPMLMYNKDRSRKTFIHPTTPAYAAISKWIDDEGQRGIGGGTKAYFYGRVQDTAVFVNVHTLAESQPW